MVIRVEDGREAAEESIINGGADIEMDEEANE